MSQHKGGLKPKKSPAKLHSVTISKSEKLCSSAVALLKTYQICEHSAACWSICSCGLFAGRALIKQTEVLLASGRHDLAIKQLIASVLLKPCGKLFFLVMFLYFWKGFGVPDELSAEVVIFWGRGWLETQWPVVIMG